MIRANVDDVHGIVPSEESTYQQPDQADRSLDGIWGIVVSQKPHIRRTVPFVVEANREASSAVSHGVLRCGCDEKYSFQSPVAELLLGGVGILLNGRPGCLDVRMYREGTVRPKIAVRRGTVKYKDELAQSWCK